MLENNAYVWRLLIDFSKAFDIVDNTVLPDNKLHLPAHWLNRLIAFITGRTHSTKYQQIVSTPLSVNRSIIQGSGIGPTFYIILESDLKSKSICNVIC